MTQPPNRRLVTEAALDEVIAALPDDPALRAAYLPKWTAATAYVSGEPVVNPTGQVVRALAGFTSGASYDASQWSTPSSGGGAPTTNAGDLTSGTLADARIPASIARDTEVGALAAVAPEVVEAVQDITAGMFRAGTNVTFTYDDAAGTFTINASGGGAGTTDPEIVRDTIGGALVGGANVQITVNDAADTLTIAVTGLATVATSGSASDLGTGILPPARIGDGSIDLGKLAFDPATQVELEARRAEGVTVLIASSGAYPARPSTALVPGGHVLYLGTVNPTDSVEPDRWDNA